MEVLQSNIEELENEIKAIKIKIERQEDKIDVLDNDILNAKEENRPEKVQALGEIRKDEHRYLLNLGEQLTATRNQLIEVMREKNILLSASQQTAIGIIISPINVYMQIFIFTMLSSWQRLWGEVEVLIVFFYLTNISCLIRCILAALIVAASYLGFWRVVIG